MEAAIGLQLRRLEQIRLFYPRLEKIITEKALPPAYF